MMIISALPAILTPRLILRSRPALRLRLAFAPALAGVFEARKLYRGGRDFWLFDLGFFDNCIKFLES